jgi:hypothetical protein
LADFTGTPARELLTFSGRDKGGADDLSLQWSPDGTTIAFGARVSAGPSIIARVFLYNAVTGRQSAIIENATLIGSVAFSPDSARLLIADRASDTVEIHHLDTGRTEPVPLIPLPLPDTTDRSVPRLLGFADNTRLLIADQRGRTMTISTTDPAGTDVRPRLRWVGGLDMYPVLASMPEGFWD